MPKLKVADKRSVKTKRSETQIKKRVDKALASVHASMAMEGLEPSKVTVNLGRQYLEGKISGQEAISKIKARHLTNAR
jgi:osmotically-inducible protein OsmY